jgi:hypothetical protein
MCRSVLVRFRIITFVFALFAHPLPAVSQPTTQIDGSPTVSIEPPTGLKGQPLAELVTFRARVTDQGRGVGRIEWRVNDVTVGVVNKLPGPGPVHMVSKAVALASGANVVEIVTYSKSNPPASATARLTITGPANVPRPRLHVLSIGINDYIDDGWTPPCTINKVRFEKLAFAAKDATAIAKDMRNASHLLYESSHVTLALNERATRANIEKIIGNLETVVHQRDTFILFIAGHGITENGRFFLIPQDYQGGPDSLRLNAIGQDRLEHWFTSQIKAQKALIVLDTCESGALVARSGSPTFDSSDPDAFVGRLHEATGRTVLAAAAEGQYAYEDKRVQHGFLTWAFLQALRNGDVNHNGTIEMSELLAHVLETVPNLAAQFGSRSSAAVAVTGSTGLVKRQTPQFGLMSDYWAFARRIN